MRQDVKPGHKVARRARHAGEPVRRYGQVIGFATRPIAVGDHVHSHNLDIGEAYVLIGLGCEVDQAAVMNHWGLL